MKKLRGGGRDRRAVLKWMSATSLTWKCGWFGNIHHRPLKVVWACLWPGGNQAIGQGRTKRIALRDAANRVRIARKYGGTPQ